MVKLPLLVLALWAGVLHAGREDRTLWANGWQRCMVKTTLPPFADVERFPSHDMCVRQIELLETRIGWLHHLHELYPQAIYTAWFTSALDDAQQRCEAWIELGYATATNKSDWDIHLTRQSLARLREMLGERDYNAGVMPGLIGKDFVEGR